MKKFSEFIGTIREAEAEQKSDLQKSYQDYFQKKLKKFGVKSPADLDDEKKKEFFNEISKDWESGKGVKEAEEPSDEESIVNEAMSFDEIKDKYLENPYGIGAQIVTYEEGERGNPNRLVFKSGERSRRDEIAKKLKDFGIPAKKMSNSTQDKSYKYRYVLTLVESVEANKIEINEGDQEEKKSSKIKHTKSISEGINYSDAADADLFDIGAYVIQGDGKNPEDADDKTLEKAAVEGMKKAKPVPLTGIVKKDLPALLKYLAAAYKKCGVELDVDNTDIDSSNFSNELMIPVVGTDYYLNTYLDYGEMAYNGSEFVIGGYFASDEEGSLEYGTSDFSDGNEVMKACTDFKEYLKNKGVDESVVTEGKISLADFYEKNIDKHSNEKSFIKAAVKMGFKEADVKKLLGDVEQGGDSYVKLSAEIFNESVNEAKLMGDEWKAYVDIEDALRSIYIKYNKTVDPKKISEFIQEQVDNYKKVGPTLK